MIKPKKLLRTYCVSVRLNDDELTKLNHLRKNHSKGEWLRMAFLQNPSRLYLRLIPMPGKL